MVNHISFEKTDKKNNTFSIEWMCDGVFNNMNDVYKDYAYDIMHRLLDAQIGRKQVSKETVIRYIKAKRW